MSNAQAAIRPATSPTLMKSSTFLWSGLDPLVRCARPYRAARQTDRTAGRTRGRAESRLLPPDTHPGLRACPEATVSRDSRRASGPPADGPRILRGIARLLTPICRTESLDGGRLLLQVERGHPHHGEAGRLEALLAEVVRRVLGQLAMVLDVVLDHQSGHRLEQIRDAEEVAAHVVHGDVHQEAWQARLALAQHAEPGLRRRGGRWIQQGQRLAELRDPTTPWATRHVCRQRRLGHQTRME